MNYHSCGANKWNDTQDGIHNLDVSKDTVVHVDTEKYATASQSAHGHNPTTGILDPDRLTKTGYHLKLGNSTWTVKNNGKAVSSETNFTGLTGKDIADLLGVLDVLKKGNVTVDLIVEWVPNTYAVKYNSNAPTGFTASGTTANSSHTYDTAKALTTNGFSVPNYSFVSWNTRADGKGTTYTNGASVKNLTTTNGSTVNLYARWKANTLGNIKYTLNGGSLTGQKTTYTVENYGYKPPTPTRANYTFVSWSPASVASGSKGDITFTANWKANVLGNIKYNLNGGTLSGQKTFYTVENYGYKPATPTRTGYTFIGWSPANIANGTKGDVTFTASWKANTYTVKYNSNAPAGKIASGTMANSSHTYDTAKALTSNGFTVPNNKFVSWNTRTDGKGTSYANGASVKNLSSTNGATVNLYAQWVHVHNSAKTEYAQGDDTQHIKYTYCDDHGTDKSQNRVSVKENHTWTTTKDWYNYNNTTMHQDQKCNVCGKTRVNSKTRYYYTDFSLNTSVINPNGVEDFKSGYYKLSKDNLTQSSDLVNDEKTYSCNFQYNEKLYIKFIKPYYDYYEFKEITGRHKTPEKIADNTQAYTITTNNKDESICLLMDQKHTALTIDPNGGFLSTGTASAQVMTTKMQYSKSTLNSLANKTPTRTGYTFDGWQTDKAGGTKVYNADGTCVKGTSYFDANGNSLCVNDLTVYAHWKAHTYTVKYNANAPTGLTASGTTANSSHSYGTAKALTANGFTVPNYSFVSQNTSADGKGTSYANSASVKNLTATNGGTINLYAQWKATVLGNIKYNLNGGTLSGQKTSYTVEDYGYIPPEPTREGYIFGGWTPIYLPENSKGDITFTAKQSDPISSTYSGDTMKNSDDLNNRTDKPHTNHGVARSEIKAGDYEAGCVDQYSYYKDTERGLYSYSKQTGNVCNAYPINVSGSASMIKENGQFVIHANDLQIQDFKPSEYISTLGTEKEYKFYPKDNIIPLFIYDDDTFVGCSQYSYCNDARNYLQDHMFAWIKRGQNSSDLSSMYSAYKTSQHINRYSKSKNSDGSIYTIRDKKTGLEYDEYYEYNENYKNVIATKQVFKNIPSKLKRIILIPVGYVEIDYEPSRASSTDLGYIGMNVMPKQGTKQGIDPPDGIASFSMH